MKSNDCLYTFACSLLWAVFTVYYQSEIVDALKEYEAPPEWYDLAEMGFLDWVLDQEFSTECFSRVVATPNDFDILTQLADSTVDTALTRFQAAAARQEAEAPGRERYLPYHYYCSWIFQVLVKFEGIVDSVKTDLPHILQSYQSVQPTVEKMQELLKAELASLGALNYLSDEATFKLRADIGAVGKALAEDWQVAVYSAAADMSDFGEKDVNN